MAKNNLLSAAPLIAAAGIGVLSSPTQAINMSDLEKASIDNNKEWIVSLQGANMDPSKYHMDTIPTYTDDGRNVEDRVKDLVNRAKRSVENGQIDISPYFPDSKKVEGDYTIVNCMYNGQDVFSSTFDIDEKQLTETTKSESEKSHVVCDLVKVEEKCSLETDIFEYSVVSSDGGVSPPLFKGEVTFDCNSNLDIFSSTINSKLAENDSVTNDSIYLDSKLENKLSQSDIISFQNGEMETISLYGPKKVTEFTGLEKPQGIPEESTELSPFETRESLHLPTGGRRGALVFKNEDETYTIRTIKNVEGFNDDLTQDYSFYSDPETFSKRQLDYTLGVRILSASNDFLASSRVMGEEEIKFLKNMGNKVCLEDKVIAGCFSNYDAAQQGGIVASIELTNQAIKEGKYNPSENFDLGRATELAKSNWGYLMPAKVFEAMSDKDGTYSTPFQRQIAQKIETLCSDEKLSGKDYKPSFDCGYNVTVEMINGGKN